MSDQHPAGEHANSDSAVGTGERAVLPLATPSVAPAAEGAEPDRPMSPAAASEAVVREVSAWEGVTVHDHRFGGVELRRGRRELGHLHGRIADLPFPRRIRDELIAAGRARPHHVLPDSGWVTVPMRTASEVARVIELFRRNYDRSAGAHRD